MRITTENSNKTDNILCSSIKTFNDLLLMMGKNLAMLSLLTKIVSQVFYLTNMLLLYFLMTLLKILHDELFKKQELN